MREPRPRKALLFSCGNEFVTRPFCNAATVTGNSSILVLGDDATLSPQSICALCVGHPVWAVKKNCTASQFDRFCFFTDLLVLMSRATVTTHSQTQPSNPISRRRHLGACHVPRVVDVWNRPRRSGGGWALRALSHFLLAFALGQDPGYPGNERCRQCAWR